MDMEKERFDAFLWAINIRVMIALAAAVSFSSLGRPSLDSARGNYPGRSFGGLEWPNRFGWI